MRSQVIQYKGASYILAEEKKEKKVTRGVMKTTVHGRASAWQWAKTKLGEGKVVAWDVMEGEDVFPMYAGPDLLTIIKFHVKGGNGRSYKDLRSITTQEDLIFDSKGHAEAATKTAEKTRTCDVCGLGVPVSKWKAHQYHLAGIRTTLCRGMSQSKQAAYAKISAKRMQAAKAQARSLGYTTEEEVESYLRGQGYGVGGEVPVVTKRKQGETNMKNAGYQGEKVPTPPKGPTISPKLTAPPFAKKDNHAPVGPVKQAVPSVAVPGKKGK